jgi:hypothetical protein
MRLAVLSNTKHKCCIHLASLGREQAQPYGVHEAQTEGLALHSFGDVGANQPSPHGLLDRHGLGIALARVHVRVGLGVDELPMDGLAGREPLAARRLEHPADAVASDASLHQRLGHHLGVELLARTLVLEVAVDEASLDGLADRQLVATRRVGVHALGVVEDAGGLSLERTDALLVAWVEHTLHDEMLELDAHELGRRALVLQQVGDGGEHDALVDGLAHLVGNARLGVRIGARLRVQNAKLDRLAHLESCNHLGLVANLGV